MRTRTKWPMLVLHIEPNAIHALWTKGSGVEKTTRVGLPGAEWTEAWEGGLRGFDDALLDVVTRLGVAPGTTTMVAFESPSAITEAQSLPVGEVQVGLASLRLAMCERLSLPRTTESVATHLISSNDLTNGVVVVAGATDAHVDAVHMWTERAGLRCAGVSPAGGLLLNEVADQLVQSTTREGYRLLLHIDEHRCAIGMTSEGKIDLLRTFDIGLNKFGEAVVRASQGSDRVQGNPLTLGRAVEILREHGIPEPGEDIGGDVGLSANAILPLLQPVIQRLTVEIKQSLRMVLRRNDTSAVRIELQGPGAQVHGLTDALMRTIDAEFIVHDRDGLADSIPQRLVRKSDQSLTLYSARHLAAVSEGRFRRAVVFGALLGFVVLGAEAGRFLHKGTGLERQTQSMSSDVARVQQFRDLSEQAVALNAQLGEAEDLLERYVGPQPDWTAALTHLANAADNTVKLTEIRGSQERADGVLLIYGIAEAQKDSTKLADFIEKLESSSLIEQVDVESRLLIELEDKPIYQFRLRASLADLRPQLTVLGGEQ